MKTVKRITVTFFILIPFLVKAETKEIPFTLDDRDRIIWAIVGIFTTMMISVFGFAFWDRKLSLAPLKKEDQKILGILVDFSKTQPKLSEILKNAGLP